MNQIDTNLTFKLDKPSIIVIDNDECIGSWGDMSIFYSLCKIISVHPPSIELFARLIGDTGCVRSGLRELYNYIINLKEKKKILGIYMCTAATNDIGWVLFLKEILEYWYGMPIYDGVIYGNMIESWHAENNSQYMNEYGVIKDMNQIRKIANVPLDTPVIALDDRQHNIRNGYSLSIEPYHVPVNIIEVGNINGDIKEITLSLTNPEDYKMFTENIIRHYIKNEIKNIMKLFSMDDDFTINFS